MSYTPQGVTFDGKHSYTEYGLWLMQRPDLGSPIPKLSIVDIPGADGNIDLTEANTGEVKYNNRTIVFQFGAVVEQDDQEAFRLKIMNALHGQRIEQIILDEDPEWFWTGRASVVFSEVRSWRLNCTVTVDAFPYATKVAPTTVNLRGGTPTTHAVIIGENVSEREWNTDIRLGTKEFPSGLPTDSQQNLIISWSATPTTSTVVNKVLQVSDSDGNYYSYTFTLPQTDNHLIVPFATLTSAGVNVQKVYRIVISGIGSCVASVRKTSVKISIVNNRRTVMPMFWLTSPDPVVIVWDGIQVQINNGVYQYDDIVLKGNKTTEVYIPSLGAGVESFLVRFREGKL